LFRHGEVRSEWRLLTFAALFYSLRLTAFAQGDTNVVTITVSHQVTAQPDQATVTVYVATDAGRSVDAALALLRGTGFTAADFSNADVIPYRGVSLSGAN
jgi:hypothetical protein